MSKPKRKQIRPDVDSCNALLQEIYNECVEQRALAIQQRNKILKDIKELQDVALVGKITNELLKITDSAIEKKLSLAKIQATLIAAKGEGADSDLSPNVMQDIRKQIELEKKEIREEFKDNNTDIEKGE